MKLKELAAAAQVAAKNTKEKGSGVLVVTVTGAEDIDFAAGGDRAAIVQGLAQAIANDRNAKDLIVEALEMSERLEVDKDCDCPACQLRRILFEDDDAPLKDLLRKARKNNPNVN